MNVGGLEAGWYRRMLENAVLCRAIDERFDEILRDCGVSRIHVDHDPGDEDRSER